MTDVFLPRLWIGLGFIDEWIRIHAWSYFQRVALENQSNIDKKELNFYLFNRTRKRDREKEGERVRGKNACACQPKNALE